MVAVPVATPVTVPSPAIIATLVDELFQIPPVVASVKTAVVPAHIFVVPVMADADAFTTTVIVRIQPVPSV